MTRFRSTKLAQVHRCLRQLCVCLVPCLLVVALITGSILAARADNRNLVVQTTSSDCGPAALATLLTYYLRIPATEKELEKLASTNRVTGTTLMGLEEAAMKKGCAAGSFRMDYATLQAQLKAYSAPVIVNLVNQEPHFALVLEAGEDFVFLADPAYGNMALRKKDFLKFWTTPVTEMVAQGIINTAADKVKSTPGTEGFVFVAVATDENAGRALRAEMVESLRRQMRNLEASRSKQPPISVIRR